MSRSHLRFVKQADNNRVPNPHLMTRPFFYSDLSDGVRQVPNALAKNAVGFQLQRFRNSQILVAGEAVLDRYVLAKRIESLRRLRFLYCMYEAMRSELAMRLSFARIWLLSERRRPYLASLVPTTRAGACASCWQNLELEPTPW